MFSVTKQARKREPSYPNRKREAKDSEKVYNDPRNNCGTYFGSCSRLVCEVVNVGDSKAI